MSTLPPRRFLHMLHARPMPRAVVALLLGLGLLGAAWLTRLAVDGARDHLRQSAAVASSSPFAEPGSTLSSDP